MPRVQYAHSQNGMVTYDGGLSQFVTLGKVHRLKELDISKSNEKEKKRSL
jgi:hypothetical protein